MEIWDRRGSRPRFCRVMGNNMAGITRPSSVAQRDCYDLEVGQPVIHSSLQYYPLMQEASSSLAGKLRVRGG